MAESDSLLPVMLEARHLHPISQNTEILEISEGQNLNLKQGVGVRDASLLSHLLLRVGRESVRSCL